MDLSRLEFSRRTDGTRLERQTRRRAKTGTMQEKGKRNIPLHPYWHRGELKPSPDRVWGGLGGGWSIVYFFRRRSAAGGSGTYTKTTPNKQPKPVPSEFLEDVEGGIRRENRTKAREKTDVKTEHESDRQRRQRT